VLIIIILAGPASLFVQLIKGLVFDVKQRLIDLKQPKKHRELKRPQDQTKETYTTSDAEYWIDDLSLSPNVPTEVEGQNESTQLNMTDLVLQYFVGQRSESPKSKDAILQYWVNDTISSTKSRTDNQGVHELTTSNLSDAVLRGPSSSRSQKAKKPLLRRLSSFKFSENSDWSFTPSLPKKFYRGSLMKRMSFSDGSTDINHIFSSNKRAACEELKVDTSSDHEVHSDFLASSARQSIESKNISTASESKPSKMIKQDLLLARTPSSALSALSPQDGSISRGLYDPKAVSYLGTSI